VDSRAGVGFHDCRGVTDLLDHGRINDCGDWVGRGQVAGTDRGDCLSTQNQLNPWRHVKTYLGGIVETSDWIGAGDGLWTARDRGSGDVKSLRGQDYRGIRPDVGSCSVH
jgi:hypothetical protein